MNFSRACVWLLALFLVPSHTCDAQHFSPAKTTRVRLTGPRALQLPALSKGDQVIQRKAYVLAFEPRYMQAKWAAYLLRGRQFQQYDYARSDEFFPDPAVRPHSADDGDYRHSGFDRGHLVPAEDMSWSGQTMLESFYYSNVSPQRPAFNRGVWKRLEKLVRYWARIYDSVYVVTGPVLHPGLRTIGYHKVAVPDYFYKAVLRIGPDGVHGIGFVIANQGSTETLSHFAVSIDSVERLTHLNLFPRLPDSIETRMESTVTMRAWRWTRGHTSY